MTPSVFIMKTPTVFIMKIPTVFIMKMLGVFILMPPVSLITPNYEAKLAIFAQFLSK